MGCFRARPGLRHVLQHCCGDQSRRSKGPQQGSGHPLTSSFAVHDPRCVAGLPIRRATRHRVIAIAGFRLLWVSVTLGACSSTLLNLAETCYLFTFSSPFIVQMQSHPALMGGYEGAVYCRKETWATTKRGEVRTGPALNPLKGSSARLPHWLHGCNPPAIFNFFVFSGLPV